MNRSVLAGELAGGILLSGLLLLQGHKVASAPDAVAQAKKELHTLRTAGTGTVRLKPDAARVFLGVQTQAVEVKEARVENNNRVRKIQEALSALKILNLKTKTSDFLVEIIHNRVEGNQLQPIVGYRISTLFTVLVQNDDPIKLGALASRVLDTALENGANEVQQITFLSMEGMTKARRKALTQAVEDALANASALVAGAKKDSVEVITIEGEPMYRDRGGISTANIVLPQRGGQDEAVLVVGDLEVTCSVNVTCTY